jgi:hypothetical protein
MEKKLLSIFFLLLFFQLSFSQEKRIEMNGVIINQSSKGLVNSHIINLTTNEGTVSDDNGTFTIQAKKGDWIQITNIQFLGKKIRVTNGNFKARFLRVYLLPKTNLLEEVEIKKKLKGVLSFDTTNKQKDTIKDQMKSIVDYIMGLGFDNIMNMGMGKDERHLQKPTVTPGQLPGFKGVGGSVLIPYADLKKKRADRKFISFKEKFPKELKKIFGEHFFFERLKIPKEKYYHFIEYCTSLGIEELYKDKKHLDILKILLKASESYLHLLEKSK